MLMLQIFCGCCMVGNIVATPSMVAPWMRTGHISSRWQSVSLPCHSQVMSGAEECGLHTKAAVVSCQAVEWCTWSFQSCCRHSIQSTHWMSSSQTKPRSPLSYSQSRPSTSRLSWLMPPTTMPLPLKHATTCRGATYCLMPTAMHAGGRCSTSGPTGSARSRACTCPYAATSWPLGQNYFDP